MPGWRHDGVVIPGLRVLVASRIIPGWRDEEACQASVNKTSGDKEATWYRAATGVLGLRKIWGRGDPAKFDFEEKASEK